MSTDIKIVGAGGEYMESVTVVEWKVQPGDTVVAGDVIVVVETAKAASEVEAPESGVLREVLANVGDEVEIGSVLGRIGGTANESDNTEDRAVQEPAKVAQPEPALVPAAQNACATPDTPTGDSRLRVSPLARRIAAGLGVDLLTVTGTGPHGRIKRRDVEQAHAEAETKQQLVNQSQPKIEASLPRLVETDSYDLRPHDSMRQTIASRLVQAKQTIPHFYLKATCEIDDLLQLRADFNAGAPANEDGQPLYKISINDLVIKAHANALDRVPDANVSWSDAGMLLHKKVDIAVAVAIPGGLITPIVCSADRKTLSAISSEMKELSRRASEKTLAPAEYQGGSSSISNLGMYGVEEFAAIINPPHASILAVGASQQTAVVKNGQVGNVTRMTITLSVDHRAVDGAVGAELLQAVKQNLESPMTMLV